MNFSIFILFAFAEEAVSSLISAPNRTSVEPTIINFVLWLRLLVETIGAVIIAVGVFLAIVELLKTLGSSESGGYTKIRLLLARYLALALEFQLGADILSTAIAPSWDQIGKLGAIAVIRTALNYFLSREMKEEREVSKRKNELDNKTNKGKL
jgi:uncharacterized membrane protein